MSPQSSDSLSLYRSTLLSPLPPPHQGRQTSAQKRTCPSLFVPDWGSSSEYNTKPSLPFHYTATEQSRRLGVTTNPKEGRLSNCNPERSSCGATFSRPSLKGENWNIRWKHYATTCEVLGVGAALKFIFSLQLCSNGSQFKQKIMPIIEDRTCFVHIWRASLNFTL